MASLIALQEEKMPKVGTCSQQCANNIFNCFRRRKNAKSGDSTQICFDGIFNDKNAENASKQHILDEKLKKIWEREKINLKLQLCHTQMPVTFFPKNVENEQKKPKKPKRKKNLNRKKITIFSFPFQI